MPPLPGLKQGFRPRYGLGGAKECQAHVLVFSRRPTGRTAWINGLAQAFAERVVFAYGCVPSLVLGKMSNESPLGQHLPILFGLLKPYRASTGLQVP